MLSHNFTFSQYKAKHIKFVYINFLRICKKLCFFLLMQSGIKIKFIKKYIKSILQHENIISFCHFTVIISIFD